MVSAATQRAKAPATVPHTPESPVKRAASLVAVLAMLTAVSPLALDMYVPGFPEMKESLHASSSAVQLTMTAVLVGLVVGQLVIGALSDSMGRRKLLIGGVVGYAVTSLLCAVAPNIGVLTAGRFLQGVAGAAGMVLARAILTDCFRGGTCPATSRCSPRSSARRPWWHPSWAARSWPCPPGAGCSWRWRSSAP